MEPQKTEQSASTPGEPKHFEEYSRILNTLKLGVLSFLFDNDLSILWASDCFYQEIGYSREEYCGCFKSLRQYYAESPDIYEILRSRIVNALNKHEDTTEFRSILPQKDGQQLPVRVALHFTEKDTYGCMICYAVYSRVGGGSIPEEEQCAKWKKRSEYFKWMLEEYADNAYISDVDTYELLYINQTSGRTLGLPAEKVIGKKCYEVIQGRNSPCPFCTNDILTENEFYEWDYYNPYLDRSYILKDRLIDWEGHRARLELSHDNLSLEYKLVKKEREQEAIIRTIPGGFARIDARDMRTILWYGGGFLQMIGYTKDEFENDLHFQCSYVHPDDIDQASRIMQISKETGEDTVAEGRIITRDGKIKILMMTYSYVSAEESWDGIESFYSVGIDITKDREEQERQKKLLEEAYQAARVASSAKTNFLSSMSHNIRTPMNAIMGMSAIAQANLDSPEKMKDCLKKIDTSSRHLLSLINEVLDMSKIESGKIDLTLEPVNLPELLQSISDICKPLVTEKEQKFQISIGQIRHENIVADGDRLQQILMNLLSNAVKYTGRKGTITLRVNELHSPVPGKSQYEFICADNGIGIPDAFMPSIFEPFSRAEDPRISKLQGTGLGMTITENIVRMMNGTITVESELGSGSKFTVSVPLEHGREEDLYGSDLKGLRVLIVDSSPFVCENAKALLNEAGMLGCWVTSGKDAVSHIVKSHNKKRDYFAVILNQKMPDLDSGEIVRNIRDRLGDSAPVFLAAADDFSGAEEKSTDLWAESLILKPLFKSKMLHALHPFATKNKTDIAGAVEEEGQVDISGKRVLLAEDNDINREIAVELLQMQDVHVDAVENGMRALEVFSASEPGEYHAILMDIQMPVLNGYQATSKIRSLDRQDAQTIPIIALSADAFTADVAKARSLGMNDHIAKPIELNRMLEVLQKWIG